MKNVLKMSNLSIEPDSFKAQLRSPRSLKNVYEILDALLNLKLYMVSVKLWNVDKTDIIRVNCRMSQFVEKSSCN